MERLRSDYRGYLQARAFGCRVAQWSVDQALEAGTAQLGHCRFRVAESVTFTSPASHRNVVGANSTSSGLVDVLVRRSPLFQDNLWDTSIFHIPLFELSDKLFSV